MSNIWFTHSTDATPIDPTWVDPGSPVKQGANWLLNNASYIASLAGLVIAAYAILMVGLPSNPNDGLCGHMSQRGMELPSVCSWFGY